MSATPAASTPFRVLIADDEPDIHAVTKLSLKGVKRSGRPVEIHSALSGKETLELLRAHPDIAVVLLDVVMENDHAGLDTCRAIRNDLGNHLVRILLRTGQPGVAPEKQTIDEYDIDGYLPKAELTSNKLYSSVRTALKAYEELVALEHHRKTLTALNECMAGVRSYAPLEDSLRRILATSLEICPAPLAVLHMETFEEEGSPRRSFLHESTDADAVRAEAAADTVRRDVARALASSTRLQAGPFGDGYLVPIALHRELGHGWLYLQEPSPDEVARKVLPMLAAHAANALYSSVAEAMLGARGGPVFDAMAV
jgi:CheY-like chemotaxis protein